VPPSSYRERGSERRKGNACPLSSWANGREKWTGSCKDEGGREGGKEGGVSEYRDNRITYSVFEKREEGGSGLHLPLHAAAATTAATGARAGTRATSARGAGAREGGREGGRKRRR